MNGCPRIPRVTFDCGVEKIDLQVYAADFMHHAWPFSSFSRKFPATCAKIPVSSTQNSCEFGGFVAWKKWNIHAGHLKIRSFPTIVLYLPAYIPQLRTYLSPYLSTYILLFRLFLSYPILPFLVSTEVHFGQFLYPQKSVSVRSI